MSKEVEAQGGKALPIQCNVRNEGDLDSAVKQCIDRFGGLDYAIYNAGAIFWDKVENTTLKRFAPNYTLPFLPFCNKITMVPKPKNITPSTGIFI